MLTLTWFYKNELAIFFSTGWHSCCLPSFKVFLSNIYLACVFQSLGHIFGAGSSVIGCLAEILWLHDK